MAAGTFLAIQPRDPRIFEEGAKEYPEAASQTYKKGALVILSSGTIAEAGAAPATVFGIALKDGNNAADTSTNALVYPIKGNEDFSITLLESLTQAMLGSQDCGVVKDATTGVWYASTADGGAQVRIVDYAKGPAFNNLGVGDTKARVVVNFHTTKLAVL